MPNSEMQVDGRELGVAAGGGLLRRSELGLSTPWIEPRSETELKLAEIWQDVLGLDAVGVLDDFFDLGGDSFAATALAAEVEATFNVRFGPSNIISFSTIAKQAEAIAPDHSSQTQQLPAHVIVGRFEGSKPPLFLAPGAEGFSFFRSAFLDEVDQDRPIYLFQTPGLDGRTKPLKTIEEMASVYVKTMQDIQPAGPYYVAGNCAGAFIALEICNQLIESGQSIARLIFLDPKPTPHALAERYPNKSAHRKFHTGILVALRRIGEAWRGAPDEFEQDLRRRARTRQRLKKEIRRRREGKVEGVFRQEHSYSPEAMLEVALQLHEALRTHIPRPFPGKAAMLLSSKRAPQIICAPSFWRDYLVDLDYRVCDGEHHDIFGAHIVETARFVKSALESPS
jgi:thioesterase domain-containing protein/acyl carrier protein